MRYPCSNSNSNNNDNNNNKRMVSWNPKWAESVKVCRTSGPTGITDSIARCHRTWYPSNDSGESRILPTFSSDVAPHS
jgi:hypothetical protein